MAVTQRYLMYLSYIGSQFSGSQVQNMKNVGNIKLTVQGSLEEGLGKLFKLGGYRPIKVALASRTDAGVHALKAAVHFDLPPIRESFPTTEYILTNLNAYFYKSKLSLRVIEVLKVRDTFSARYSPHEKTYMYRLGILKAGCQYKKSQLEQDRTCLISGELHFSVEKAKEAMRLFLGEKDFRALMSRPLLNSSKYTICKIKSFEIEEAQPIMPSVDELSQRFNYYHITCVGNRFLYQMVRRMISIILSVANGKLNLDRVHLLFDKPDFSSWPNVPVVPGYGLYLIKISYKPEQLVFTKEDETAKSISLKTQNNNLKKLEILMSLFSEIIKKKKELKPCSTVFTSPTGTRFLDTRTRDGSTDRQSLPDTSGFVVDERLDLQIAQIFDYLCLSSQDPAQDEELLTRNGITHVLSVGVDLPHRSNTSILYKKVDLLDEPGADLEKVLNVCFEFIEAAREKSSKNKVLVHCNAGYSRAPTVVIGFLMKKFKYSLSEALNLVRDKRNVKPNEGFLKQLKDLEKKL